MKLLRFGPPGDERPGLVDDQGRIRDLSDKIGDIAPDTLTPARLASLKQLDPSTLPPVDGTQRIAAPVARAGKLVCIGLNYEDHAREAGLEIPNEPVIFMKAPSALAAPNDPVTLPPGSVKTDWEVELAVVIAAPLKNVDRETAREGIAGFTVFNDLSERAWQIEGTGQWVKGKSYDGFAPVGPWIVTPDEIDNPQNLKIWLEVNGERRQDGNTKTMIFGVYELVSFVSRYMTLLPGDVLATGTPPGVGLGMKPPTFLKAGDEVRLGIEGLGEQHQMIRSGD
jgi:2,4-didehydro-3-deoxy-L-rhamnonate hydrolase